MSPRKLQYYRFLFQSPGSTHYLHCPSKEIGSISPTVLSINLSSWLQSHAFSFLAAHPMVLASSGCWVLLQQLGLTQASIMHNQWCQASAALHHNFMHLEPVPPGDSYTWPSSCAPLDPTMTISGTHPTFHSEFATQKFFFPQWCWIILHQLLFLNYTYSALIVSLVLLFLPLKPEPSRQSCWILLLEVAILQKLHFLSFVVLELAQKINLEPRDLQGFGSWTLE